ncbi:hypothetical protein [Streptomyces sp. ST2-7A]|uniref:hypothetical protein n=1 Tax=Streptomyces sp. ST2-7A TaxID=2907214 RepID=UPI001F29433C|nr:hypothetical protein [Streptomyces sp. ST2-7A]MCE7081155.1 hypothetical protein [Streptomyces sp. ST2-7A]
MTTDHHTPVPETPVPPAGAAAHPRTGVPLAPVGWVAGRPVWPVLGGDGRDDEDDEGTRIDPADDDGEDGTDPGDDDGESHDDDATDDDQDDDDLENADNEELKTRLRKQTAALRKANKEAKRLRLEAKARRERERRTTDRDRDRSGEKDTERREKDADRADDRAHREEERTKRLSLSVALTAEGLTKEQAKRLAGSRLINLDDVDLDDDGWADWGDQIEDLRDDFPALFAKAKDEQDEEDVRPRRRTPRRPDTSNKPGAAAAGKRKLTPSERQARALMGNR